MLHDQKSQSIVQWFNSLTTKENVNTISQFADGFHFYEIVTSLQPPSPPAKKKENLTSDSVIFSDTSIACNEEVITSVEDQATEEKIDVSVSESESAGLSVIKDSDDTDDVQKKYDVIKKFIDDCYNIESSSLIDYKECLNGKELELAKVAIFLLATMVTNFLSSDDKLVFNTTLLDQEVQENIHECLSLVLKENNIPIKKSELHKVLSKAANYKATPVRKQPSRNAPDTNELSDSIKNVPKKRRDKASVVYEYPQESPLKSLLESPKIQYKAAAYKMGKELAKFRSAFYNEEDKVKELTLDKENINRELEKTKKDFALCKRKLREEMEEQEKLRDEELKEKMIEIERIQKLLDTRDIEIKYLGEKNKYFQEEIAKKDIKVEPDLTASFTNEEKKFLEDTILQLQDQIKILNDEVKKTKQKCQELSEGSDIVGSTIFYADNKSSRVKIGKKSDVASPQTKDKEPRSKKEDVEYYERKNIDESIPSDSNSIESEMNGTDNSSEICTSVNNIKTEPLTPNASIDSQIADSLHNISQEQTRIDISIHTKFLLNILQHLEKRHYIPLSELKNLQKTLKITNSPEKFDAFIRDFTSAFKEPFDGATVTRRSSLTIKNKNLEPEFQRPKQNFQLQIKNQMEELKTSNENLETTNAELKKKIEKLENELSVLKEKYVAIEKLCKKKELDVKRALMMYQRIVKLDSDKEGKRCENCENHKTEVKQLKSLSRQARLEVSDLKNSLKNEKGKVQHLEYQIKELKKEKKNLEQQLWEEKSALSSNIAERDALVLHYLTKKDQGLVKKLKHQDLKKKEEQKNSSRPIIKVDAYILNDNEPCTSNSMLSSRSFRNGFFQTADEDDFLNESSLAEIHSGGILEEPSGERRLQEIRRRNTLCPPHLQSSYPLEIQGMTPSEKKYYHPDEVSFSMGRQSSVYQAKLPKKPMPNYREMYSEDSDESHSSHVIKRKFVEAESVSVPPTKKHCQSSYSMAKKKPSTPMKRASAFLKPTPGSIHRLVNFHRKKKAH